MDATKVLRAEHRLIEQVLSCLETIVEDAVQRGRLDWCCAHQAVGFFSNFAEGCHQSKEERHLFPVLASIGPPVGHGEVAKLLREHNEAHWHLAGMIEPMTLASRGRPDALERFARHARAYIELMRAHMQKEETSVFPALRRALESAEHERLAGAFESVENEQIAGARGRNIRMAGELVDRLRSPV